MEFAIVVKHTDLAKYRQVGACHLAHGVLAPCVDKLVLCSYLRELHHQVISCKRLGNAVPLTHSHPYLKVKANLVGLQNDEEQGNFLLMLIHRLVVLPKADWHGVIASGNLDNVPLAGCLCIDLKNTVVHRFVFQ